MKKLLDIDDIAGKRVWVTSDLHAKHNNIVVYSQRPGYNPLGKNHDYDLHNQVILNNHNALVRDNDIVLNLGDISFRENGVYDVAQQLNGVHYFIKGNHDSKATLEALREIGWIEIEPFSLKIPEGFIAFSHYPIYNLPPKTISVHGHVHNNPYNGTIKHFNVSTEVTNYTPVLLDVLMNKAKYVLGNKRSGNNNDADRQERQVLSRIKTNIIAYSA